MNLNKTLGRVATTLVAATMLASVTAVPAFANEGEYQVSDNKITIKKELVMPSSVVYPGATFTFDVETGELNNGAETYVDGDTTLDVKVGTVTANEAYEGQVAIDASATPTTSQDGKTKTYTANVDITLPSVTYNEAGVYKYKITERDVNGYNDVTDAMDLYVIVERTNAASAVSTGDSFLVTGAVVRSTKDTKGKTDTYTNYYKLDDDGTSKVGSVALTKNVTGAMGSHNDTFTFTVTGLPTGNFTYTVTGDNHDYVINATTNTIDLKSGQTATIVGVDEDTVLTIAESDYSEEGYELVSVTGDDDNAMEGCQVRVVADDTKTVTFTNNRDAVSPTGIVMNVAPYVLLVVVAAAGCFVFLRKRRED